MASSSENPDEVQFLSRHDRRNDSANAQGTMASSSESPNEVQFMWSRALGTGISQNPIVISDDDDVIFVSQKRLRTQPRNQDPIVVGDDEDQDDDVVFVSQKRLRTHPIKHESIKHEPIKHESIKHEPIKHEPIKHEPIKHEPIKHEPIVVGEDEDQDDGVVFVSQRRLRTHRRN